MKENFSHPLNGKGSKRWKRLLPAVMIMILVAAWAAWHGWQSGWLGHDKEGGSGHRHNPAAEKYTCPMHPEIVTGHPGDCPICGMKLVPLAIGGEASGKTAPSAANKADDFFNDLKTPAERVASMVGSEVLRAAGVQTAPASEEELRHVVRAAGLVTADETRIRQVRTKIEGWVESLAVNFTGQVVTAGQPLLTIYSPTLLTSQEEFLQSKETAAKFNNSSDLGLRKLGQQMFDAARRRLELFDVPPSFVAELEKSGQIRRAVTLNAPVAGFVTGKTIFEGQQIAPGQELFTITDLSRVWIEANFYEYEAREVKLGQEGSLTLPSAPGLKLQGKVTYVYPVLTPESRTVKVRFEFANQDLALKPGMYADVSVALATGPGVVIPDSAVMDTGARQIVFVELEAGTFEPREVITGIHGQGKVQILSGVKSGEAVVVKANFLLDSESRLRASVARVLGGEKK